MPVQPALPAILNVSGLSLTTERRSYYDGSTDVYHFENEKLRETLTVVCFKRDYTRNGILRCSKRVIRLVQLLRGRHFSPSILRTEDCIANGT